MRSRSYGPGDHNASIYSADGSLLHSFHAGDAIHDVQVDKVGAIWVSFFDEGVFSSEEPAQAGLVCFNKEGQMLLKYNDLVECTGALSIADCYAMNVCSQEEVWLCPYTEFPLVQLVEQQIKQVWLDVPVRGSQAFAISSGRALFAGGYENWKKLFLVTLDTMSEEQIEAVDQDGARLSFRIAYGRGSRLYLVSEQSVFVLDLDIF
jgi:hypothetical protein